LRFIDPCITQLKAQGPSRTCTESKEEEEDLQRVGVGVEKLVRQVRREGHEACAPRHVPDLQP